MISNIVLYLYKKANV